MTKRSTYQFLSAGFGLLVAFVFLYKRAFVDLAGRWNTEDFSYCYLVPFLAVYLAYLNRDRLLRAPIRSSLSGLFIILAAGIIFLTGKMGALETVVYFSMWLSMVGTVLLFVGWQGLRIMAFPLIVLFFAIPLPPFLNRLFTFELKLISSSLSVDMMRFAGILVFGEGNIIDLGATQLQVVDACSGLRYVYPLVLMGLVSAYLFHKKWWERTLIVAATIPIAIVSNALRIAITGILTEKVSPAIAESFYHGFSGWFIFMVSVGFLFLVSRLLRGSKQKRLKAQGSKQKRLKDRKLNPKFDFCQIKQSYIWAAVVMLLGFSLLQYSLASAMLKPTRTSFERFPLRIGNWEGEKSYLNQKIMDSLWADDYVQIRFVNRESGNVFLLFIPYYEVQGTKHTAHSPVSCLLGGGWAPKSRRELHRVFAEPFGPVTIKQMVLEKEGRLMLANYWFQMRGRIISNEYLNKWYLFLDSITRRRTDGALVRLEMPLAHGQHVEAGQAVLDEFTLKLEKVLPEFVPN